MPSKSKIKGASAENALAKILEAALQCGKFIRSNSSGAIVGGSNFHRRASLGANQLSSLKGDLAPPDALKGLVIESKSYADFSYHMFVANTTIAILDDWIEQTKTSAEADDLWLLCWKSNRRQWAVTWSLADYDFDVDTFIRYKGKDKQYYGIANLEEFLVKNKDKIIKLSSKS